MSHVKSRVAHQCANVSCVHDIYCDSGKWFHGEMLPWAWSTSDNNKLDYLRDSTRQQSLCCSKSFKVTNFASSWKPISDFILVN